MWAVIESKSNNSPARFYSALCRIQQRAVAPKNSPAKQCKDDKSKRNGVQIANLLISINYLSRSVNSHICLGSDNRDTDAISNIKWAVLIFGFFFADLPFILWRM